MGRGDRHVRVEFVGGGTLSDSGTAVANGTSPPEPLAAPPRPVWYRRRAVLVTGAVALVVGFTVLSDLPESTPIPQQVQQETAVIQEIHTDADDCIVAIQESFTLYHDELSGKLSSSDKGQIPTMLGQDQGACSFTNSSIYDLANIEVPGSAAGRHIGDAVNTVTVWVSGPALSAIEAIQTLTGSPGDATAQATLISAERGLAADRAKVTTEIEAADRVLDGAHLPYPGLPSLPQPAS